MQWIIINPSQYKLCHTCCPVDGMEEFKFTKTILCKIRNWCRLSLILNSYFADSEYILVLCCFRTYRTPPQCLNPLLLYDWSSRPVSAVPSSERGDPKSRKFGKYVTKYSYSKHRGSIAQPPPKILLGHKNEEYYFCGKTGCFVFRL